MTGAHLCRADTAASLIRTTETKDRTDIQPPPSCFILVEATHPEALTDILLDRALSGPAPPARLFAAPIGWNMSASRLRSRHDYPGAAPCTPTCSISSDCEAAMNKWSCLGPPNARLAHTSGSRISPIILPAGEITSTPA